MIKIPYYSLYLNQVLDLELFIIIGCAGLLEERTIANDNGFSSTSGVLKYSLVNFILKRSTTLNILMIIG